MEKKDTPRILANMNKQDKHEDLAPPMWAEPVKAKMRQLGLRQDDLMLAFEVNTRGAIGHYFTGRRKASVVQLMRLAAFLDLIFEMMARGRALSQIKHLYDRLNAVREVQESFSVDDLEDINLEEISDASSDCDDLLKDIQSMLVIMRSMRSSLEASNYLFEGDISEKEVAHRTKILLDFSARVDECVKLFDLTKRVYDELSELELSISEEDIEKAKLLRRQLEVREEAEEHEIRSGQMSLIPTAKMVPVISWVAASSWNEAINIHEPGLGDGYLPCPVRHSKHTYALRVEGDSMTSTTGKSYPHGSVIFVDPEQRGGVRPGDRVVAKLNGHDEVTFKQLAEDRQGMFLKPLNSNHQAIYGEFKVLGKVIGKWEPE